MNQFGERNYESLYNILRAYRRVGGKYDTTVSGNNFNKFDNPGTLYFRIFFDFQTGLLDCVDVYDLGKTSKQLTREDIWKRDTIIRNSALNYLTINNEWERANMLRDFINLLSNISTYSPWYFMGIEGLGDVLERTEYTADEFTLPEMKTISIKCLPDSYDQRIGTLIDLYRAMCFSQQLHKEVIPANLRRFNMFIYIFPANTRGIHTLHQYVADSKEESKEPVTDKFASYDHNQIRIDKTNGALYNNDELKYLTSSKLILLKGCEIDLNTSKTGYENMSNDEGFDPTYTISIKVRYAEEQRYNEFLMKRIGDLVVGDMDMPGDTDNGAGKSRDVVWDAETANRILRLSSEDERLTRSLKTGMDTPKRGEEEREDMEANKINASNKSTNTSIYRDNNKSSLLDPWLNMGEQQLEKLAGQANQVVNAGKSALSSWTDIEKLNGNLASSVNGLVNRLMFGNIFETNLQDFTTGLTSGISGLSSGHVLDSAMRGKGWSHEDRKNGSITPFSSNPNLRQSVSPSVPADVEGNIFGR